MNELMFNTLISIKQWLINDVKKAVAKTCYNGNPSEFQKWQGNCCLQTSIAVNYLLTERLRLMGYKEIQSWEGQFDDIILGQQTQYNHAWVYCIHESDRDLNLLVDVARNHKEPLVVMMLYPSHPDYAHMRLISKERLNVTRLMKKPEYYTGLDGRAFMTCVKRELSLI
jgi:hypothetical protein